MKFIVDAQLPQLLAIWLKDHGFDAIHTLELQKANHSDDQEDRIIISKDSDFFDDHILRGQPKKLLIVKTGNIKNSDLIRLFERNTDKIAKLFERYVLIEMNRSDLIVHE